MGRPADELEDLLYLVERGIARENGFSVDELAQDAADRPHVYRFRVLRRTQQDLRRPVPSRGHVLRQHLVGDLLGAVDRPRQPEIGDLRVALRVEQQVARLQIPVDKFPRMHVLERFEELIDDKLLVYLFENAGPDDYVEI